MVIRLALTVSTMESAMLPRDNSTNRFEVVPPGQAAIITSPTAMAGGTASNVANNHPFRIHRHLAEVTYRQGHADTDHDNEQSNRQSCRDKRAGFHNASGCFCFYCNQPVKSSTHWCLSGA